RKVTISRSIENERGPPLRRQANRPRPGKFANDITPRPRGVHYHIGSELPFGCLYLPSTTRSRQAHNLRIGEKSPTAAPKTGQKPLMNSVHIHIRRLRLKNGRGKIILSQSGA